MKCQIAVLLLLVLLLPACTGIPTPAPVAAQSADLAAETAPTDVTAEGRLLPAQRAELAFVQAGILAEPLANEGQSAAAGDVLAGLVGAETAHAELAAAELEQTLARQATDALNRAALQNSAEAHKDLQSAQKAYESEAAGWSLPNKDTASDLELALDNYIRAETDYRAAKQELDRYADKDVEDARRQDAQETFDDEKENLESLYAELMEEIPTTNDRLSEKQTALLKVVSGLVQARQQVDRLEDGLDREQRTAAEARLKAAEARLAAALAAQTNYELRAPFAGMVLSRAELRPGEAVHPGQPVIYLGDPLRWEVETKDLAEIDVARVVIGQSASVKLDAFPGETFHGTVTTIDPVGREYLGDMTYRVIITLDAPDPRFLWNMTAAVTIQTH